MPLWLLGIGAFLSRIMASRIGHWIISALLFLGIQFVATEYGVDALRDQIQGALTGAPAQIIEWLAFLNIDKYVTIVLSAYATAAAMGALRMRRKPAA